MHELSCTQNILATAIRAAEEGGASKILGIRVSHGKFSGILPEFVNKYFLIISKGTIADGAELIFEEEPIRICCRSCGNESELGEEQNVCPCCGSTDFRILTGWDVCIKSIKVE